MERGSRGALAALTGGGDCVARCESLAICLHSAASPTTRSPPVARPTIVSCGAEVIESDDELVRRWRAPCPGWLRSSVQGGRRKGACRSHCRHALRSRIGRPEGQDPG